MRLVNVTMCFERDDRRMVVRVPEEVQERLREIEQMVEDLRRVSEDAEARR